MKQVKLSTKIIGGFAIVVLLMMGVVGVYQFSTIRTTGGFKSLLTNDIEVERRALEAEAALELALRAKANFLLNKELKQMDTHREAIDRVTKALTWIKTNEQADHPEVSQQVDKALTLLADYQGKVEAMLKSCQAIGLTENEGLQKGFRAAAQAMQEAMPEHEQDDLLIALLNLRRYEKDYLVSPADYHDKYQGAITAYGGLLKAKTDTLEAKVKQVLPEAFAKYQTAAGQLLADPEGNREENLAALKEATHTTEAALKTVNVPGAKAMFLDLRKSEKDYLLRLKDEYSQETSTKAAKLKETFAQSGIAPEHIADMGNLLDAYLKSFEAMVSEQHTLASLTGEMQAAVDAIEPMIRQIDDEASKSNLALTTSIADQAKQLAAIALAASLVTIALALALGFALARSICRPIDNAVKNMLAGAEQVAAASGQVSSSAQALANGATEQAASLEETSASMEEMASMTRQNADNASQADALMRESLTIIQQADGAMTEMGRSMGEIAEASAQTSKIIKTIDEIAFQTNLLALNAAVEAARAGEAGAGFAVVAEEVRNLAMRSTEAAKNTAALIEGTVDKVNSGQEIVTKTTEAFHGVAESSAKVATLIGEIASASHEQAQGFGQINQAITQMDTVTQQNSATAEESAAAATELNSQSASMMEIVKEMQSLVNGGGAKAAAPAPRPAGSPALKTPPPRPTATSRGKQASLPAPASKRPTPAAKTLSPPPPKKSTRPEDVIPMDNDDNFEDF